MINLKNLDFEHSKYFIYLVNCAINEITPTPPSDKIDWNIIYNVSTRCYISPLICDTVCKIDSGNKPSKEVIEMFVDDVNINIFIDANQRTYIDKILNFCEENEIRVLFLKGTVLKSLYPKTYQRVMSDIDFWIEDKDTKIIENYIIELGFKSELKIAKHDTYILKPYCVLELHRALVDSGGKNEKHFEKLCKTLTPVEGYKYNLKMDTVNFYVYLVQHIKDHLFLGGISTKMLLDFYVLNKHYNIDKVKLDKILQKLDLLTVHNAVLDLVDRWFTVDGVGYTGLEVEKFVIECGIYGNFESSVIIHKEQGKKRSLANHLFRWLFPKFTTLKIKYKVLKKYPFLTIFMYIPWWIEKIKLYTVKGKKGKQQMKSKAKLYNEVKETSNKDSNILDFFGL